MSVFLDEPRTYNRKYRNYCHMMANNIDELHKMAEMIGLKRRWFQNHPKHPHYDLSLAKRNLAISFGAISVDSKSMIEECGL